MQHVVVEAPGSKPGRAGGPRGKRTVRLSPGESLDFGYRRWSRTLMFGRQGGELSVVAGQIIAGHGYWSVSNFNAEIAYLVENTDDAGEYIKVAPCRAAVPIPFESSRLVLPGNCTPHSLHVLVSGAPRISPSRMVPEIPYQCGGLDSGRKHFLVLVALCEPRLLGDWHAGVPTVPEVVERLRPLPGWRDVSRNAVNYHIDYLFREKLRAYFGPDSPVPRVRWKREALVSIALRHDLVRVEHLSLLPPP
ncbi:MAG TPA: serine/threonine protein kinase [Micromonosporaceae bacterium]